MTSYNTTAELVNVTSSTESSTVLQAILDDANRELAAYLKPRGVSATSCDELKTVELKLAKAGLLDHALQSGKYVASSGEFVNGADISAAMTVQSSIRQLREAAFAMLDDYIAANTSMAGIGPRCARVRAYRPRST